MSTDINVQQGQDRVAERTRGGQWYRPQVDILETRDELMLMAEMPGVKCENIDINFEDGVLTVQGRAEPRYPTDANFLLMEYGVGDFYRTFRVSEQVNPAGIHAEYAHGVLTVHLPKAEAAKPRKIVVQAASN